MEQTSYRAIFFDLDGTLLPLDMDSFMGGYYLALKGFVADAGYDSEEFTDALNTGIVAMGTEHPGITNEQIFWRVFLEKMGKENEERLRTLMTDFYEKEFGSIGTGMPPEPRSAEVIEILRQKGYPLALTTMPMFPPRATLWRMNWGDIDPSWFEHITVYDNSTSIKPFLAYYQENLDLFGCKPEEVLMVGNNTLEDFACLDLGMHGFLVTDHLINPNNFDVESMPHGSMGDLLEFVKALPPCTNPAQMVRHAGAKA